jgi:hypothetical protein
MMLLRRSIKRSGWPGLRWGEPGRPSSLDRLVHIEQLLAKLGWDVSGARPALFARDGFTTRPEGPLLIDLAMMYA